MQPCILDSGSSHMYGEMTLFENLTRSIIKFVSDPPETCTYPVVLCLVIVEVV